MIKNITDINAKLPLKGSELLFAQEIAGLVRQFITCHHERETYRLQIAELSARFAHVENKLYFAVEALKISDMPQHLRELLVTEFCNLLRE